METDAQGFFSFSLSFFPFLFLLFSLFFKDKQNYGRKGFFLFFVGFFCFLFCLACYKRSWLSALDNLVKAFSRV